MFGRSPIFPNLKSECIAEFDDVNLALSLEAVALVH